MAKRYPSGFISAFYNPLKNPDAPTIGTATGGDTSASVPFTAPAGVGGSAITSYGVQSTPDGIQASGSSSPISVTGLTNGTPYTFAVWALNSYGPSAFSAASNSVTPAAPVPFGLFGGGSSSNVIDQVNISTGATCLQLTKTLQGAVLHQGDCLPGEVVIPTLYNSFHMHPQVMLQTLATLLWEEMKRAACPIQPVVYLAQVT